ncbi:MAG: Ig-like domain-containing protein [Rubrobacter sp.]|nr:Ig-like domain-containing protein [Rubrobacter sp.]
MRSGRGRGSATPRSPRRATLDPFGASATLLARNARYKAVVTTGARDAAGNRLDQSPRKKGLQQKAWTFTTGAG